MYIIAQCPNESDDVLRGPSEDRETENAQKK